jgi:predicted nucleotidyltransferase
MDEAVKRVPTLDDLRAKRNEILRLAEQYGATNVRVFGSVARGDARSNSDIDFLVDFPRNRSIFDLVGLWQALTDLLGCEVDLVVEEEPADRFMQAALRDAQPL